MQRWPILFVLFSSPAFGQDSIEDKGRTCTVITDSLARLVCYDEVFAAPSVSPSPALAAFDTPWQVDLFNEGGLNSTMATGWDGETSVDFFSIQAVSDISYVAFTVNEEGTEQVAIGSFDVMRLYNNERLVKLDWGKHERTRMVTCASFTNTETDKNYVVLNFLEEQPSAASGESPLSTASHYAAPLSLTHDGNFSCDEATHSYFIADIPHADRLPKPANASAPEEPFDGRTRESALELMVDAIMSDDLYFDLGVTTQRHLADIEFLMTVDPVGIDANSIKVGSRVAYMPAWSYLDALEMMGATVFENKLPWDEARFTACATYFDVAERRYIKEVWSLQHGLSEMRKSPNPDGGYAIFPDDVSWSASGTPMRCQ